MNTFILIVDSEFDLHCAEYNGRNHTVCIFMILIYDSEEYLGL